jgi:DNA-binding LacI/PurR family transcriptional regulator
VLRTAGKRIPEDVAVIGFDDILEARSQIPPLTAVRHPTFTLGHQALLSLLRMIRFPSLPEAETFPMRKTR